MADKIEIAADAHVQQLSTPGGTDWEGDAADIAQEAGYSDRGVVYGAAELMRKMRKAAYEGAGNISQARELALDAISDAEVDGFQVGDDLTVTDPRRYSGQQLTLYDARRTKVDQHHSYIAMRARNLAFEDAKVGAQLDAAAVELDGMIPLNWGYKENPASERSITPDDILERYQVSEDPDGMVDWEPSWPASIFTDPQYITAGEARMLDELGLSGQRDMQQAKEAAQAQAISRFPPPDGKEIDNHTDAFRHAYWNALMTQRFGEEWTRQFTTAHERRTANYASSEAMDLWNNEVGRRIAAANPDASSEQLAGMVEQAVRNGETVVIRPDGQGVIWSDQIPVGGPTGDSSVSAPVQGSGPDTAPMPQPGGGYDPGQPGGYATAAGGY
ncbi:DUF6973 domain-containing protein [Mycolicibacterium sp. XJ870]